MEYYIFLITFGMWLAVTFIFIGIFIGRSYDRLHNSRSIYDNVVDRNDRSYTGPEEGDER